MASEAGRGAQVRLDGGARQLARGGVGTRLIDSIRGKQDLEAAGVVADGNRPDGSTRTGLAAEDEVLSRGGDEAEAFAAAAAVSAAAAAVSAAAASGLVVLRGRRVISGDYTLVADDANRLIETTAAATLHIGLPAGLPEPFAVAIHQNGDGQAKIIPGVGATLQPEPFGYDGTRERGAVIGLLSAGEVGANVYAITGDGALVTVPDAPTVTNQGPFTIAENAAIGAYVGYVGFGGEGAITLAITAGDPTGRFAISSSTGQITVAAALDYDTTPVFALSITASNAGGSNTAVTTVTLTDVAAPIVTAGQTFACFDGIADGTVVGTAHANRTVTSWAIAAGPFSISAAGIITKTAALNAAVTASYTLALTATDAEGASAAVNATFLIVASGSLYAPIAAGAVLHWNPADTTKRTLSGSEFSNLADVNGTAGYGFPWHASHATTNPAPTLAAGVAGIGGVDAIAISNTQALYAAASTTLKSIDNNTTYLAFECVFMPTDAAVSSEIIRATTNASNTAARFSVRWSVASGEARINLSVRRRDADTGLVVAHSAGLTTGVAYYLFCEVDYAAQTARVIASSIDESSTLLFTSGAGSSEPLASSQVILGYSNSVPSYFKMGQAAFYRSRPTEAARLINETRLRATYGLST